MGSSHIRQIVSRQDVVHAYRHLYRQGLKAIRYSTPSRHVLRTSLRASFRDSPPTEFDSLRISNTLRFLERACNVAGLEHKILKNLLLSRYWELPNIAKESRVLRSLGLGKEEQKLRKVAYNQLSLTLKRLNESLGTCLK
ncbi:hypothetical protein N7539_004487 [Penicillium diatomitis]|uniref:Uncharacterized protein n=1 Tax=Penicillium diatomitis TaxID=2819901 RepID=A0A9X0BYU1_9EURO|nr:uncharacterized protein N7539_004487 [Penicillium diatomitis]KAJ5489597.1 hypothetical protein N7539_004487 [Penicillium diatomitis]